MSLNRSVTISTKEGNVYKLAFTIFDTLTIPDSITKPIVDVTIAIDDIQGFNNPKTLFSFSSHIKEYLTENDVILYCYCDDKEIIRCKRHQGITPQQYRSLLFQRMFERVMDDNYINKPIILTNSEESHYIQLFTRVENHIQLESAFDELMKLNK